MTGEKHQRIMPGLELAGWDKEHRELLDRIAPEQFDILHYAALAVLRKYEKSI